MKSGYKHLVLVMAAFSFNAFASEKGSADEAIALVKKTAEYLKANGKEKTLAEVNNPKGQFTNKDLYVFVHDLTGMTIAHGANQKLIGRANMTELKDVDGKYFIKEMVDIANVKGKGWVDYKWPHPVTKEITAKSVYIERAGDVFIGTGIHK